MDSDLMEARLAARSSPSISRGPWGETVLTDTVIQMDYTVCIFSHKCKTWKTGSPVAGGAGAPGWGRRVERLPGPPSGLTETTRASSPTDWSTHTYTREGRSHSTALGKQNPLRTLVYPKKKHHLKCTRGRELVLCTSLELQY